MSLFTPPEYIALNTQLVILKHTQYIKNVDVT